MALSGQKTTADYIEWDKLQGLILKLERDGDFKFAILIAIGSFTGLLFYYYTIIYLDSIISNIYVCYSNDKKSENI